MDMGKFALFLKMLEEEYKLPQRDLQKISRRLMADDSEFDRVWKSYKNKGPRSRDGNDSFRPVLQELLQ